ncbi:MAG TPA: diacylglycerol kinase family protein [Gemmatimonadales bacterium]|nr:diacylglycerol kinase family protein [Gemmatimonadales bacterium]
MTRALLITNPAAARTHARAVTAIRDTLRGGGWSVEVLATAQSGDARRFAEQGRVQGVDVFVCYGGDGTAMQIAAGAVGSGIPLGLVPGGTGNLLAGNLRLPRRPTAAARVILTGTPLPIDLGVVERRDGTHYFAVCCGTGFDARLMAATGTAEKSRWKMAAYVGRALAALPGVTSPRHRVTVDGATRELAAAMVLIANCGELVPPFLRLSDDVAPDDGWLDVVALTAEGPLESLAAFAALLRHRRRPSDGSPRVWFGRGRAVRVEVLEGPPRPMQLDGEPRGDTPFEARVLAGALPVIVDPLTASGRPRRHG